MPKASKAPAKGFYAVHVGKTKGIYFTWPECEKQVKGVIGAKFKKFETLKDAEEFVRTGPKVFTKPPPKNSVRPSPYAAAAQARAAGTSTSGHSTVSDSASSSSAGKDSYIRVKGVRMAASDMVVVYTDGSSLGNGKVGCQAGVGVFFGVNDPRNVSERLDSEPQTNQRAELMAALRALEVCGSDVAPIEIRTDSMYTVNIVTKWADGWIKNNWKRSDGEKVLNRDIIEPLIAKIKSRLGPIKWVHVRAHIGTFGNEMADKLANAGAVMPRHSTM
ncbi:hypothetical protein BG011_002595 [Mortierella polycephala]|uniref:Ribonuclease H n=1 Tax=Mortierella polycephala TaxID=41804 RepID=A0A9P6Q6F4_9FUNG|nr:hypothetical protein BG011_002595 [Mortierella polycephala]